MTKCVILAGGRGTRISEESDPRPKPMIEIGGKPILWHIMKSYAQHGIADFVVCLGFRGYVIKEYFANYCLHESDVTVNLRDDLVTYHGNHDEPWSVTLVDTGLDTMTGGRIRRIRKYLPDDQPFCLTYGDGLCDIDFAKQVAFHESHGLLATMTVVRPPARFGSSVVEEDRVVAFHEKPQAEGGLINGGFFVLSPRVVDLIAGDHTPWEHEPLERLADSGQLAAWQHWGFWQPMDTIRERDLLQELWEKGDAPWKVWDDRTTDAD